MRDTIVAFTRASRYEDIGRAGGRGTGIVEGQDIGRVGHRLEAARGDLVTCVRGIDGGDRPMLGKDVDDVLDDVAVVEESLAP